MSSDQPKLNLKGRTDKLTYYREIETGTVPAVRKRNGKEEPYWKPVTENIYFTEEDVRKFTLDKYGQSLPYTHGHVTIINNYMFDYWGHFVQAEGLALYGHLLRHCYGEKDWCWPDIPLIAAKMGKSVNTVKSYLALLEEYGFVFKFQVMNASKKNTKESNLYKVRKKIPFLPADLIEKLPENLREDHDKYLEQIAETFDTIPELDEKINYNDIYIEFMDKGVRQKQKSQLQFQFDVKIYTELLKKKQTDKDISVWENFLLSVNTKLSKASYETWFKNSFLLQKGTDFEIYFPTVFARDHVEQKYHPLIMEIMNQIVFEFDQTYKIRYESVERVEY